jgi:hypothetical protein
VTPLVAQRLLDPPLREALLRLPMRVRLGYEDGDVTAVWYGIEDRPETLDAAVRLVSAVCRRPPTDGYRG